MFLMWPNVPTLLDKQILNVLLTMFDRLASASKCRSVMSQNICLREAKMFVNYYKTLRNVFILFVLLKQCYMMWPDGQTLLLKKSQMFDQQCLIVWPGP